MALTVLRCVSDGSHRWGVVEQDRVRLLPGGVAPRTIDLLWLGADRIRELAATDWIPTGRLDVVSPVTTPGQIMCQGLNYGDHAAESGHARRSRNMFFPKAPSSISGPFEDVVRPADCELLDFEVEVGIVLRRDLVEGARVSIDNIGEFIGAFVACNDMSARDQMFGAPFLQWFVGKSGRTFCPCGPYLLIPEPGDIEMILAQLELRLWLNGEIRQSATTVDMIFKPGETLTEIAGFMDMAAGDLLLTGTPGGILAQGTPEVLAILGEQLRDDEARRALLVAEMKRSARFLQPGDTVRTTIASADRRFDLGTQTFGIVDGETRA